MQHCYEQFKQHSICQYLVTIDKQFFRVQSKYFQAKIAQPLENLACMAMVLRDIWGVTLTCDTNRNLVCYGKPRSHERQCLGTLQISRQEIQIPTLAK